MFSLFLKEVVANPVSKELILLLSRSLFLSLPQLCSVISTFMPMLFISQIKSTNNVELIAGVGLSESFTFIVCSGVCAGLTTALGTLLPQSFGAGHTHLITLHVQRAYYLISIVGLFLCTIQFFAGNITIIIGQPKELSTIVNNYCRMLIPAIFVEIILFVLNALIQSLDMNKYLFYSNIFSIIIFVPVLYILIYYTSLGYLGGAAAFIVYNVVNVCGQVFILYKNEYSYIFRPLPLSVVFDYKGCISYIKLAIPGLFGETFEWILFEIALLLSGYIENPATAISITVIIEQIDVIVYSITYGCSQAISLRVAEYIGVGNIKYAQRTAKIGICFVSIVSMVMIFILLISKYYIASIWTYDEEVIGEVVKLIYVYALFVFAATIKEAMMAIYTGLGFQYMSAITTVATYLLICFPILNTLLFIVGYNENMTIGLYSIWGTWALGNSLQFLFSTIWMFRYVDWNKSVTQAKIRFEETHSSFDRKLSNKFK
eukprot:509317_1